MPGRRLVPPAGAAEAVLLGLGANVGDPRAQLVRALAGLTGFVSDLRMSSVYRTAPVGNPDQPDFLNLVAAGRTALSPAELLERVTALERAAGRVRTFRNAPRELDVDVLDLGGRVLESERLTLPHPGIANRPFVLVPLAEVAPEWRHPVLGRTARELLDPLPRPYRVELAAPPPILPSTS